MPSTIRPHRVYKALAERVWRAFLDPDAVARFMLLHGFTCTVHEQDDMVGGVFRMSFTKGEHCTRHLRPVTSVRQDLDPPSAARHTIHGGEHVRFQQPRRVISGTVQSQTRQFIQNGPDRPECDTRD
ncbi:MAG: SRPBCC domain-containing protein [Candidatus Delongbacteria bacterium]|nr:SRPBCC domain-containing protein [Candidatus Delongbacteria bacterium]